MLCLSLSVERSYLHPGYSFQEYFFIRNIRLNKIVSDIILGICLFSAFNKSYILAYITLSYSSRYLKHSVSPQTSRYIIVNTVCRFNDKARYKQAIR